MTDRSRPVSQRLLALLLALLLCLAGDRRPGGRAGRAATARTTSPSAVNQKDGSSVFDFAFEVRRVSSGVVDQTNAAVAYANCESCQTVAIAVQIVLVSGGADTITPTNVAIAINESCISCQTLALAYQFVFGTGRCSSSRRTGAKRLKEIQKEFDGARQVRSLDRRDPPACGRAGAGDRRPAGHRAGAAPPAEDDGEDTGVAEGTEDDTDGEEEASRSPTSRLTAEEEPAPEEEPLPPDTDTGEPEAEPVPPEEPAEPAPAPEPARTEAEPTAPESP